VYSRSPLILLSITKRLLVSIERIMNLLNLAIACSLQKMKTFLIKNFWVNYTDTSFFKGK
jgi:hypothetical protein